MTVRACVICLLLSVGFGELLHAQVPATKPNASESDSPENQPATDSEALASRVTVHRDEWGLAHVIGEDHLATVFGSGYVQAEDFFWQLEDNCIRAIGRHAEVHGESELRSDMLNRMFEIVPRSKTDFESLEPEYQNSMAAFAAGVNYFLATHPDVKPRLIQKFEPWHVLAMDRHFLMDFCYGRTHAGGPKPIKEVTEAVAASGPDQRSRQMSWDWHNEPRSELEQAANAAIGSNAWAISGQKTSSGHPMLFINPHQPWYGWGQFFEIHLMSKGGGPKETPWNFTGAAFYGNPVPTMGHNERLGWAYTVNDPDIADAWTVTFDDPAQPLNYKYDGGYRTAREWVSTIGVKKNGEVKKYDYVFRATHHGPIARQVGNKSDNKYTAVNICRLFDTNRVRQAFGMLRASNLAEWRAAFGKCAIPMFNCVYADVDGNIQYVYNGSIPKRNTQFDWKRPVDGSRKETEWNGVHELEDLPQVINPLSGFVQNCNSSPFVTTDDGNPGIGDFPSYMFEDADHDKRRSRLSRMLLREAKDVTFEKFHDMTTDTRLYWPLVQLPKAKRTFDSWEAAEPEKAAKIKPYLDHLLAWDCRASVESTQTALCVAWYEELYGMGYPAETLKENYRQNPVARLKALSLAAKSLKRTHGDWKVAWGDVHRLARVTKKSTVVKAALSFNRLMESEPCPGAPGPLGVVFTVYSSPTIPIIRPHRYAIVGNSYMSAIEFAPKIRGVSLTPFGVSGDSKSKHYFDQAKSFSKGRMKPSWFYEEDVVANAKSSVRLDSLKREAAR